MSTNVRCAGGGFPNDWMYVNDSLAGTSRAKPCGWKGTRKNDREYFGPYGMEQAAEIDPCPRCGGRVELWEAEDQGSCGQW